MSTRPNDAVWLGKYRLDELLGRGGMAEVWRATLVGSAGFERQLAIKRIRSHLADDREFVQMFLSEARLTAQLHHPNIVQIVELGESGGEYFLAMELVRGHDLQRVARWLARRETMPAGFAAYVGLEIARALAYAHSLVDERGRPLGLVHRDVSPSNVMLGLDGSVKLLDFGIAKAVAATSDVATRTGALKGKLGYFSPEQVRGETPDHRADQFAVGVVLHELLTGKSLFRRNSDVETLALVMQADALAPSQINSTVPPALDAICLRALAREPEGRFPDCRELARALEPIAHDLGWGAPRLAELMKQFDAEAPEARPVLETPRVSSVARQRQRRRRRKLTGRLLGAALVAVMLAGGGLMWWAARPASAPPPPPAMSTADLAVARDLATPTDLVQRSDLAAPRDLATPRPRRHAAKKEPDPTEPVDPFAE